MTVATIEGRSLVLAVEGVDRAFTVGPLSAARGAVLTQAFIRLAGGQLDDLRGESILIESIRPANYARVIGDHVRLVVPTDDDDETYLEWGPSGIVHGDERDAHDMLARGGVYVRWAIEGDVPDDVAEARSDENALRQEEAEKLSLCAFLWQTALGMDAVRDFIADGEGTEARLKAIRHLSIRTGHSTPASSSQVATASSARTASSSGTRATASSSGPVRLPAKQPRRGTFGQPK